MKILRALALFALFYVLTACVQIGIVGGPDGPTTIIINFRNPVKGGSAS